MLRSKRKERDGEDELDTGEVEPASGVVVLDGKSTGSRFGEEMDDLDVSKECVFSHKEGIMHGSVEWVNPPGTNSEPGNSGVEDLR